MRWPASVGRQSILRCGHRGRSHQQQINPKTAATGDLRSNSLVTLAVEELGLHVRALARRLFGDERAAFRLALHGGLLAPKSLLRRRLEQRLKSIAPGAQLLTELVIPARGAARMAMREAGVRV